MNRTFGNVSKEQERARAYATLQFPGTSYLAFRDLRALIRRYNHHYPALDFGCGTGRSTGFLRNLGLIVVGADISQAMLRSKLVRSILPESTALFATILPTNSRRAVLISFWLPSRLTTCQPKRRRSR